MDGRPRVNMPVDFESLFSASEKDTAWGSWRLPVVALYVVVRLQSWPHPATPSEAPWNRNTNQTTRNLAVQRSSISATLAGKANV